MDEGAQRREFVEDVAPDPPEVRHRDAGWCDAK